MLYRFDNSCSSQGTRVMLLRMADLLLRYPDEQARVAAAQALAEPDPFLAEAPDLDTVAEWLQLLGEATTAAQLQECFARTGQVAQLT